MPRRTRPRLTRPVDFDRFWDATLRQLDATPAAVERTPVEGRQPALELEHLSFGSLGAARVHGYLVRWRDGGPRPLVVHSHGYGSECAVMWSWADRGLNVLGVDIRGFGRSRGVVEPSRWGYMLTGRDRPEHYVLRGAVCDVLRAVQMGRQLLGGAVGRVVLHGLSFAGGLALMAEGLGRAADLLVVGVPTFGWAEGRHFYVRSGSGREVNDFLSARPEQAEDLMLVLRYFDPINFAGRVQCPTLVGVGMRDEVVPAPTVFAIANHLGGPREIMEFPVSHTDAPEEQLWDAFQACWIDLALHGLPETFGKGEGD